MAISPLYIALLFILLTVLGMNVSRMRIKNQVSLGDGGNKAVRAAIRAHGNSVEHIVPFAVLLLVYELSGAERAHVAWAGGLFLAVRVGYAIALLGRVFRLRQVTAALSFAIEMTLCVLLVIRYA